MGRQYLLDPGVHLILNFLLFSITYETYIRYQNFCRASSSYLFYIKLNYYKSIIYRVNYTYLFYMNFCSYTSLYSLPKTAVQIIPYLFVYTNEKDTDIYFLL
jgi:hypothetical protein